MGRSVVGGRLGSLKGGPTLQPHSFLGRLRTGRKAQVHSPNAHLAHLSATCQGMAGNIIHAVATTNAIASGLIVVEAMKLLAGGNSGVAIAVH